MNMRTVGLFLCRLSWHRNFLLCQSQREEAKKFAEIKRKLRLEIQELRETVLQMMRDNQEAPELERLDRHEFNLDVDQRQKLVLEGEEKIKQVWASNSKSQNQFLALCLNTEKYWWFVNIAYIWEQGLLYGWICERARWCESCVLIGYPSSSCPLGISRVGSAETVLFLAV